MASLVFAAPADRSRRVASLWVCLIFAAAITWLAVQHVMWRDEVRALSFALQGQSVREMLHLLSDGHPALWHLMLRGLHALTGTVLVLPALAWVVAMAAALLLAWRSPFAWPIVALILLGRGALYDYSVVARNYGISLLLMLAFAALYSRFRQRGIVLGVVLALLANCNVHSTILVGGFLLFWLGDLHAEASSRERPPAWGHFALNAAIAVVGIALCAATVYPTANDAAERAFPAGPVWVTALRALLLPDEAFRDLLRTGDVDALLTSHFPQAWPPMSILLRVLATAFLVGSTLGLVVRPAAMVASWVTLIAFSLLSAFIYQGAYRHHALWLVFLVSLYWIAAAGEPAVAVLPRWKRRLRALGLVLFVALLAMQAALGVGKVAPIALGTASESRSRDLARLLEADPRLRDAILVADPDYLVEPLPYYLPTRAYLMREGRFGQTVTFSRHARQVLSLDEVLREARGLQQRDGRPVVILLAARLDPAQPARAIAEGYSWTFTTTPGQVGAFLAATDRIASFGPVLCCTEESFDVYVLKKPDGSPGF